MKRIFLIMLVLGALVIPQGAEAQCAMCRAVLESGDNAATAQGINNGIVYLMAVPYIAIGVLFYFVYQKMRPKSPQEN